MKELVTHNAGTSEDQKPGPPPQSVPISGRFDRFRSSYWAASVAVLPLRYLMRPLARMSWENPQASHNSKHAYAGFAGMFMYAVTAYYAMSTWKDMRNIFKETLALEFDKNPENVTFQDFRNSKNTIIQQTAANYIQYNLRRFGVNTAFFLPFIFKNAFRNAHPETGVDLGVAANAAYLFSDVLTRKITPFEELQALIDQKLNHAEHYSDKITASDLLDIYERHASAGPIHSFLPQRGTPEWERSMQLFDRMADLVNQTYCNTVLKEKADFKISKFIYLIGEGLIDPGKFELSRTYIEVANKHGIKEVKHMVEGLAKGRSVEEICAKYASAQPPVQAPEKPEESPKKSCSIKFSSPMSIVCREEQRRAEREAPTNGLAV